MMKRYCENCQAEVHCPPGAMDTICQGCGSTVNPFGQVIAHPHGQGPEFAGEAFEADDDLEMVAYEFGEFMAGIDEATDEN